MERVGIIGVGEIGRALVTGLRAGADGPAEVFLSPRGARTAAELAGRHPGVTVCRDNQEVADRSELVVLAVRRADLAAALAGLEIAPDRVVLNVMAGVGAAELRAALGTAAPIVRAIPLPSIAERRSVTVVHPAHPAVEALLARTGGTLPVPDEAAFDVLSALTGALSTHLAYLAALASWAADRGIDADTADHYVRGLFTGLGRGLADPALPLDRLAAAHETPGGSNERLRTTWFTPANAAALTTALDTLLTDLGRHRPG
ncbi:NAD(P)-binding domain-containing protein [Kitasatospora sp. NPDC088391]|uniref:NAD(P)-binding domain-containing protein n=1 Tax=Kitasatospora sp. NPDC088391 TaxID=3364074 RepID=UPI00382E093E